MSKIDKKIGDLLQMMVPLSTEMSRAVTATSTIATENEVDNNQAKKTWNNNAQQREQATAQQSTTATAVSRNVNGGGFLDSSFSFGLSSNFHLTSHPSSTNTATATANEFPTLTKLADMSSAAAATSSAMMPASKSISAALKMISGGGVPASGDATSATDPDIRMSQLNVVSSSRLEHPLKLSPSLSPPTKAKAPLHAQTPGTDGATEIRILTDAQIASPSNLKFFEYSIIRQ